MLNLEGKKAILFDCDGTLADTQPAHKLAYELAFALNGISSMWDPDTFDRYSPFGGDTLMTYLVTDKFREDIILDKQRMLPYALEKVMVPNMALINLIREQHGKIPMAVVSNGRRGSITKILKELGVLHHMSFVITKEDTTLAKPSPAPYLKALDIFGIKGYEAIVFEDNNIGVESATKAGIIDVIKVEGF